ncbi:D-alanyl-D-alanine carboxypeptidase [Entomortierella parvispora]|uniref:D-alanyl-D-alanine carboxypeptidase n=1 Tax=Entomortierella parvispora TaxID=205924 RepID=A0A9P3LYW8_9FUNG|nr:D-alanyl-D-alanine carboxypeptidase [Entomortierella parvispora]
MKIATVVVLGAALQLLASTSIVEGLPFDSQTAKYDNWRKTIDHARKLTGVPGMSVAVMHKGKVIFAEGFGQRNKNGDPVTAETLMPIGSMTKAMTAAMIGELVAEGKLDWDKTPVVEYVPEARFSPVLSEELTLSDYLSHRSGLPHDDTPWTNTTETRAQVFRRLKNFNLPTKLSTNLQYSNVGYAISGEAAANVAGVPYEQLVHDKIFRPLGLSHTGFSPVEMGKRPNHAMPFYSDSLKDAQAGIFHEGYLDRLIEFDSAAGDIYSNMDDLLKWGRTIMKYGEWDGEQILNRASVEQLLTARTIARGVRTLPELGPATTYSFGWFADSYKGQSVYYHGGNTLGFSSIIALFPESDLVIASLTNTYAAMYPNFVYYYLADEILNLPKTQDWTEAALAMTERVYNGTEEARKGNFPRRQKNTHPSHPLKEYVGVYTHPLFAGDVTLTLKDNHLIFHFTTFVSRMEHYHFDSFSFTFDVWSVKSAQLVTFLTGQDGKISGFEFEHIDKMLIFEKKEESKIQEENDNVQEDETEEMQEEEKESAFEQGADHMQFKLLRAL